MLHPPFIEYIKKRIKKYRFNKSLLLSPFVKIFWEEYYPKINNPNLSREITDSTLNEGEGRKWAIKFYNQRFKNFQDLEKQKIGLISADKAYPIFRDIVSFIIENKLQEDRNLYLIQLGSCSGADLKFFYDTFPNLSFISTDVSDEILDFQKEKYNFKNFDFFKTHAENINDCFKKFNLYNKKVILFSRGSLQYVNPYFLELFFSKLSAVRDLNLFICDTIDLDFLENQKKIKSNQRFDIVFNHRYEDYLSNSNKVIKNEIIKPFSEEDINNFNIGLTYLHIRNS